VSVQTILDHRGGVLSRIICDPDEQLHMVDTMDVEPLIRSTKIERDSFLPNRKSAFRPYANVPETTVMQAMREGWFMDKKRWRKWVNDNPVFKITNG